MNKFLDFGKFTALMGVGLVVYAFYVQWTVSLKHTVWGTNPVQVPSASAILSGQEFVAAESPGRGEGRQIELSKNHQNHVNFNIESKRFLDLVSWDLGV